jgi:YVTN family beta-propeller protein
MEYLMTYGWSILIIAVVLAALYQLGVFSGISANGNSCVSQPGFLCSSGSLNTAGTLTFKFGYAGSGVLNISAIGCSNSTAPPTSWSSEAVNISPLPSGQSERVVVPCNLNGKSTIGAPFAGTIWVQYYNGKFTATQKVGAASYTASSVAGYPTSATATISTGGYLRDVAYNPNNGYIYVMNQGGGSRGINIISGNTLVTTISLGYGPYGVAYSPSNGYIYATNGDMLFVISGTTVLASVHIGNNPQGVAYNPSNGEMYVVNEVDGTVSVISGTSVVGSPITVGSYPYEIAYNPSNGYMYVANYGGSTVSVISGTTVVNTITVGTQPYGVAYNPSNGYMYVANYGSGTVSVISGNNVISTITVGSLPHGIAYNPSNEAIYVMNFGGGGTVNMIFGTSVVGSPITVGSAPYAAVYNPGNGYMYVTNANAGTVSVI